MAQKWRGIGNLGGLDPVTRAALRKVNTALKSMTAAIGRESVREDSASRLARTWSPRGNSAGGSRTAVQYGNYSDIPQPEQLKQKGVGALLYISVDETSGKRVDFFDGSQWVKLLKTGDAAASSTTTSWSKTVTKKNPTSSEDISIFFTPVAITLTEIRAVLIGSATPSVTWTVRHATDRSVTGTEVVTGGTTTTSTTTGSDTTSFTDSTIPADSFVWLETTAKSGTVTELHVTVVYTID